MKIIGRKLYLQWGEWGVIAIEKLPGLTLQDVCGDRLACGAATHLLAEIRDILGERTEKALGAPADPTPIGADLSRHFEETGNWLTSEDKHDP